MQPVRLQRRRVKGFKLESPNGLPIVCVTRGTKWGNPFKVRAVGQQAAFYSCRSREECLNAYKYEIDNLLKLGGVMLTDPKRGTEISIDDIVRELRGKNLACFCPLDKPCHADVLLKLANEE